MLLLLCSFYFIVFFVKWPKKPIQTALTILVTFCVSPATQSHTGLGSATSCQKSRSQWSANPFLYEFGPLSCISSILNHFYKPFYGVTTLLLGEYYIAHVVLANPSSVVLCPEMCTVTYFGPAHVFWFCQGRLQPCTGREFNQPPCSNFPPLSQHSVVAIGPLVSEYVVQNYTSHWVENAKNAWFLAQSLVARFEVYLAKNLR